MTHRKEALLAPLLFLLALAGCADHDAPATKASAPMDEAGALAGQDAPAEEAADGKPDALRQRKLIQNAELRLEVESYPAARKELDALLASHGGYVADVTIEHVDGDVSRADLVLRVPNERLASFLRESAGSGEVLHEQLRSQDITDQYVDLEARLKSAKRLEGRLLELMAGKTDTVGDLLEVERELARVRGEIERMEGQKRQWDKQVALSTVHVELITRRVYAAAPPQTLGERIDRTFNSSLSGLVAFGRGALLVAVALVPWLLPLFALGWLIRAALRRARRRFRPTMTHT